MVEHVTVLGVRVDAVASDRLNREINNVIESAGKEYFANVNIHAINLARRDAPFREFLNSSRIVYCDGEGVRLGARILGAHLPPRIVLTYWIWEVCEMCERRGHSIFLLGGTERVVRQAADNLRNRFPHLQIVGAQHGYFPKAGESSSMVVEQINQARPNILFVCFGMPLQEHWVRENFHRLHVNVVLFGGSTIDYTAGLKTVAPPILREHGLEWLYRLVQEPGRLWKRYLLGNPLFLARVLIQRLRQGTRTGT
jgi:N-acetylglucosaminyldiphosphoundecaprenol N-acetyl-beta-D-mannosaminyltransferase